MIVPQVCFGMFQRLCCPACYCRSHAFSSEAGNGKFCMSGMQKLNYCLSSGIDDMLLYAADIFC